MVLAAAENKMKKDCFAYKLRKCTALVDMVCAKGEECPFYKTREQFNEDAEKARIRNERKAGVRIC